MSTINSSQKRRDAFFTFATILLVGNFLNVVFNLFQGRLDHPVDQFPWAYSLFGPSDRFNDFFNWIKPAKDVFPYFWAMPPLSMLFASFWRGVQSILGDEQSLTVCLAGALIFTVWSFHRALERLSINGEETATVKESWFMALVLSLGTYPMLFAIDRANVSLWVVPFILMGFLEWQRGSVHKTSIWWALAAGIKITPVVLSLFFLSQRRYRAFFTCLGWMLGVSVLAIGIYKFLVPEYSFTLFQQGLKLYFETYALGSYGLGWSVSFFGALKTLYFYWNPSGLDWALQNRFELFGLPSHLLTVVFALSFLKTGDESPRVRLDRLVLTISWLILGPYVMADYYLQLLLLPVLFLLSQKDLHPQSRFYLIVIALNVIPKSYHWGMIQGAYVSCAVWINPLLTTLLFVTAARNVFTSQGSWLWRSEKR